MNIAIDHRRRKRAAWRDRLYTIIFEPESEQGKLFGIVLMVCILLSVAALMLESVPDIGARYASELHALEWVFTILFMVEYIARLICARSSFRYAVSFFGLVDLLAILPVYIGLVMPVSHYLMVIRVLRLLRVFRILQMTHYLDEANFLLAAIRASYRKIVVFVFTVVTIVIFIGSLMYVLEGGNNGFTSIWTGVYWALGTLTMVDSGDVSPHTSAGRLLASVVMILGYGILAVPTGIVTVEMTTNARRSRTLCCPSCGSEGHDRDARYCKHCGSRL